MNNRLKSSWFWVGTALLALVCWPVLTAVLGGRASAQLLTGPQLTFPRFGGQGIYSFGSQPFTTFGGGQFGSAYFGPNTGYANPQGPVGYYLIPVDPSMYMNPFANVAPATDTGANGQSAAQYGAYPIARTNDTVEANYDAEGNLRVRWDGQAMSARVVRFAVLDAERKVLKETIIDRLPVEAKFDKDPKAEFMQAVIVYVNGTSNSMEFPVRPPAAKVVPGAPKETTKEPPKEAKPGNGNGGKVEIKP